MSVEGAARFVKARGSACQGIVGLPNVGKSSLFNLLTETSIAQAANFPFCTIDPNEARAAVPDERYDWLCELWQPASRYPAFLQVTDIAGLVRGAHEGAGLGNAFLSHIGAVDGIYHVVRAFDSEEIVHVDDSVDPVRDLDTINAELCKKDLQFLDKAVAQEEKDVKKSPGMKLSQTFKDTMAKVRALLEANKPVRDGEFTGPEVEMVKEKLGNLTTTKPMIYLVNISKKDFGRKKNKWFGPIAGWVKEHGGGSIIPFSIEYEQELFDAREDPAAREALVKEYGPSALPKMIKQGYEALRLIHFFTCGEKEVRCWTVNDGALAPAAGSVIHTDFEKFFIKAEVVSYSDFKEIAKDKFGMADVKAAGKYRLEGKQYKVKDGDIL